MKVYTKGGDAGTTSLVGGKRIKKYGVRIEAYGTIDELNSSLGMLAAAIKNRYQDWYDFLLVAQNKLFNIGCYLATDIEAIEKAIDEIDAKLPALNNFVLPGGSPEAAFADVCRTTARRGERRVVELAEEAYINPLVIKYLNRLSDFFFVFARFNNVEQQIPEIFWNKDC